MNNYQNKNSPVKDVYIPKNLDLNSTNPLSDSRAPANRPTINPPNPN